MKSNLVDVFVFNRPIEAYGLPSVSPYMTAQTVRISGTNYCTLLISVSPVSCSLFSSHVDDATLRQPTTIMEVLMPKQGIIEITVEMYWHGILECFTIMAQLFWCER